MNTLLLLLGTAAFALFALRKPKVPPSAPASTASAPTDAPVNRAPKLRDASKIRRGSDPAREALQLTNAFRAKGGACGGVAMPPVGPLSWSDQLAASALAHAKDMAARGYFAHITPEGGRPEERMAKAGWHTMPVGENIAAGQSSPSEVVQGWIDSPGHCKNLLNGSYKHIGIAYFYAADTQYKHYWVQNFGG